MGAHRARATSEGPRRPPTIFDIARESGISKTTVSRVLNGAPHVSAATRTAVLRAVEQLGYRRNKAAASLRTSRSSMVGLLVPAIHHELFSELAERLEEQLREREISLVVTSSGWSTQNELTAIDNLEAHSVDALVASLADDRDPSIAARLKTASCPVVLIDREVRGLASDSIRMDYRVALDAAVAHLASLGHRSIGLMTANQRTFPGREMSAAHAAAVARYGCDPSPALIVSPDRQDLGAGRKAIDLLLAAGATAVIVGAPAVLVAGVISRLRDLGVSIPHGLSLIVYSDSDLAATHNPPLSFIDRPLASIGRLAAKLVVARLDNPDQPYRTEIVSTRLVLRASTGPVAGTDARKPNR